MEFKTVRNDIAEMTADAIVLPANTRLVEGPGASAAIFEKAGRNKLKWACKDYYTKCRRKKRKLRVGMSVASLAYDLNADYIIHAIVPKWIDGKHDEYGSLSAAYLSALGLSDEMGCRSIAFPLLASGNNGFNLDLAFQIAKKSIEEYQPLYELRTVILVVYGYQALNVLKKYNIDVKENIDQKYIFAKEEAARPRIKRLFEGALDFAGGVVDKGLEQAENYLADEEHQYKVLEEGKKIAAKVVEEAVGAAGEAVKGMFKKR